MLDPAAVTVPELLNTPAGSPGFPGDGGTAHSPYSTLPCPRLSAAVLVNVAPAPTYKLSFNGIEAVPLLTSEPLFTCSDLLVSVAPGATVTVAVPLYWPPPDSAAVTVTFPPPCRMPFSTSVGTDSAGTSDSTPSTSTVDGPLIDAPLLTSTSPLLPITSVADEGPVTCAPELSSALPPARFRVPEAMLIVPVSLVTMQEEFGYPIVAG